MKFRQLSSKGNYISSDHPGTNIPIRNLRSSFLKANSLFSVDDIYPLGMRYLSPDQISVTGGVKYITFQVVVEAPPTMMGDIPLGWLTTLYTFVYNSSDETLSLQTPRVFIAPTQIFSETSVLYAPTFLNVSADGFVIDDGDMTLVNDALTKMLFACSLREMISIAKRSFTLHVTDQTYFTLFDEAEDETEKLKRAIGFNYSILPAIMMADIIADTASSEDPRMFYQNIFEMFDDYLTRPRN